jgi:hypothetical protein
MKTQQFVGKLANGFAFPLRLRGFARDTYARLSMPDVSVSKHVIVNRDNGDF